MSSQLVVAWFGSLFALAAFWLSLVFWLFRRLRLHHPATYEAIGSPSLFWNNSMRNNWLFMKFLWQSKWQCLEDAQLSFVVWSMRVVFVIYAAGFVSLCAVLFVLGVKPA